MSKTVYIVASYGDIDGTFPTQKAALKKIQEMLAEDKSMSDANFTLIVGEQFSIKATTSVKPVEYKKSCDG